MLTVVAGKNENWIEVTVEKGERRKKYVKDKRIWRMYVYDTATICLDISSDYMDMIKAQLYIADR